MKNAKDVLCEIRGAAEGMQAKGFEDEAQEFVKWAEAIERLKALLVEARNDIREGVENEYPPAMRHYPAEMRRYQAGMDIVYRIDAALAGKEDV